MLRIRAEDLASRCCGLWLGLVVGRVAWVLGVVIGICALGCEFFSRGKQPMLLRV